MVGAGMLWTTANSAIISNVAWSEGAPISLYKRTVGFGQEAINREASDYFPVC